MPDPISLLDVSHTRARGLLASGAPVYLPVNPVEYHGPHLSLHNDALISRGLIERLHAGLLERGGDWPVLVAADLEVGVDPCPGPGSRATPFREVRALVLDACRRLVELGAKRVVIMTFHGSPLHCLALDAGVRWLASRGVHALSPMNLLLRAMRDMNVDDYADAYATVGDEADRRALLQEAPIDFHAGFLETSLAMVMAPRSVAPDHTRLPPCPPVTPDAKLSAAARAAERFGRAELASELRFAAAGAGWYALRPFPAYTSRPHLASVPAGEAIARHMVRGFADAGWRVLRGEEPAPRPIMTWMSPLTLGGSFATTGVPLEAIAEFGLQA
jgi:creatinine amidohydrolase